MTYTYKMWGLKEDCSQEQIDEEYQRRMTEARISGGNLSDQLKKCDEIEKVYRTLSKNEEKEQKEDHEEQKEDHSAAKANSSDVITSSNLPEEDNSKFAICASQALDVKSNTSDFYGALIGWVEETEFSDEIIKEDIVGRFQEAYENKDNTTLDISGHDLPTLPDVFGSLGHLRVIDISYNQLTELPFEHFSGLEELNASDNQLSVIPAAIENCTELKELNLSDNEISEIPESIEDCTELKKLNLSNNQISVMPEEFFWHCKKLTSLNLSNNNIREISENLYRCDQLEELDVSNNKLSTLPDILNITNPDNTNTSWKVINADGNRIPYEERQHFVYLLDEFVRYNCISYDEIDVGLADQNLNPQSRPNSPSGEKTFNGELERT